MSYGLEAFDAANRLAFTTKAPVFAFHYIGQATYSADFQNFWTDYTISSVHRPIVFVAFPNDGGACIGLHSMTNLGGDTWRIRLLDMRFSGSGRARPTVHCFARLSNNTPASPYGMMVFDASHNAVLDTTRNPLVLSQSELVAGLSSGSLTPPDIGAPKFMLKSMTSPAFHAVSVGFGDRYTGGTPFGNRSRYYYGWALSSGGFYRQWGLFESGLEDGGAISFAIFIAGEQRILVTDMARYL